MKINRLLFAFSFVLISLPEVIKSYEDDEYVDELAIFDSSDDDLSDVDEEL